MELADVVGTTDAAQLAGVAICTISAWKRRGLLTPIMAKPPLYMRCDVLAARANAHERGLKKGGRAAQLVSQMRQSQPSELDTHEI